MRTVTVGMVPIVWQALNDKCVGRAVNTKMFETVTETADKLLSMGFENIYEETKETIQAMLDK